VIGPEHDHPKSGGDVSLTATLAPNFRLLPGVSDGLPSAAMAATRDERIATRTRNEKWQNVPLRIEMSECINCDACLRHCPPHFGAIFNHGADVIIVPELCSGCDKCLPACPVDCIYPDPDWQSTTVPADWWDQPNGPDDPYR
jgi:electron transport complex protein RnfB